MKTDDQTKESGTHQIGLDLIEVKFEYEANSDVKGFAVKDAAERKKIVLLAPGHILSSLEDPTRVLFGKTRVPRTHERWLCRVLTDTDPKDPKKGRLFVQPIEPRHLNFPLQAGGLLHVPEQTLIHLKGMPHLLRPIFQSMANISPLSQTSRYEERHELLFHRHIGFDTRIQTPRIGYQERAQFVNRGVGSYIRVVQGSKKDPIPASSITLWIGIQTYEACSQFRLYDAAFGSPSPRGPQIYHTRDSRAFDAAVEYWTTHAFLYEERMGPILNLSWQDIVKKTSSKRPKAA